MLLFTGDITSDVLRVCTEARTRTLGPFSPSFNVQAILLEGLERVSTSIYFIQLYTKSI